MIRHYITSRGQDLFVDVRGDTVWTAHDRSGPWVDLADPRPFHQAVERGYLKPCSTTNDELRTTNPGPEPVPVFAEFSEEEEAAFEEWLARTPKVKRLTNDNLRLTISEAPKAKKRGKK